jgi:hypothetical protein
VGKENYFTEVRTMETFDYSSETELEEEIRLEEERKLEEEEEGTK